MENKEPIQILLDPCHCLKLIRNTFGDFKVFIDGDGGRIDWEFKKKLYNLQETEGFNLANKLKRSHLLYFKQKMKVKLAAQLFSKSVADALDFCCKELKLKDFEECVPTINFIRKMNVSFDILNSHSIVAFDNKRAICESNVERINETVTNSVQ